MKPDTRVATSLDEAFDMIKVRPESGHTSGRKYYTCPKCSDERKGFNKKSRCLAVNVDNMGVRAFCNHCERSEVVMLEGEMKRARGGQSGDARGYEQRQQQQAPKTNGYETMQRAARARWARR